MRLLASLGVTLLAVAVAGVQAEALGVQEQLLSEFAGRLTNFQAVYDAHNWTGWGLDDNPLCPPDQPVITDHLTCSDHNVPYLSAEANSWTGVTCSPGGEVFCLALNNYGLEGPVDSAIAALTVLPMLKFLQLRDNSLTGTLGSAWAHFQLLEWLDVSHNRISGSLPPDWAGSDALPRLVTLRFQHNAIVGTLPPEWGAARAWSDLHSINMTYNNLTGPIPASWAPRPAFSSIRNIFALPGNDFCGEVPEGVPIRMSTSYHDNSTVVAFEDVHSFNKTCPRELLATPDQHATTAGVAAGVVAGMLAAGVLLSAIAAAVHIHARRHVPARPRMTMKVPSYEMDTRSESATSLMPRRQDTFPL